MSESDFYWLMYTVVLILGILYYAGIPPEDEEE
jgi:hypothetical protein